MNDEIRTVITLTKHQHKIYRHCSDLPIEYILSIEINQKQNALNDLLYSHHLTNNVNVCYYQYRQYIHK